MRITDDERREVAAKIRGNADDMPFYGDLVANAAGADVMDDEACWNRLADLIEPAPTSSDRGPTCDRDALLELADRVQLIHSDPSRMGREACDYYGVGGDLDCGDCEAYTSDLKCLDLAIADVSRRIRAIANGLEGGSDAPAAGDEGQTATDAHADGNEAAEAARTPSIEVLRWINEQGGIEAVKARLMPEGCEWPRYEDGGPVRIGGEFMGKDGKTYTAKQIQFIGKCFSLFDFCDRKPQFSGFYGERVRRPAVLAADGNRIEPAMDVWWICEGDERGIHAERLHVDGIDDDGMVECSPHNGGTSVVLYPAELYVKKPVLDADGVPIREGDTVYGTVEGGPFIVTEVSDKGSVFVNVFPDTGMHGSMFTHAKPEPPDSWERIEEDAKLAPGDYIEKHGRKTDLYAYEEMPIDLVRRCKALAERED